MDLSFYDRFEIFLHLPAGAFNEQSKRKLTALLEALLPVIADDDHLVVLYLFHLTHSHPNKSRCPMTAELDKGIVFPDAFAFKCRPEGNGYRGLLNCDLEASELDGTLDDLRVVKFLGDF